MKKFLIVAACAVVGVLLFHFYSVQDTKIVVLQSKVDYLMFVDSVQNSRIDNLREHTFKADSMLLEAIKEQYK